MQNTKLIGYCGLYCGACEHYVASLESGKHLLNQIVSAGIIPEDYICAGCRANKKDIYSHCKDCKIRSCNEGKNISHCALCTQFPCDTLVDFQNNEYIHHRDIMNNLKELHSQGLESWSVSQESRWKCQCDSNFSWYESECDKCHSKLDSYTKKI